MFERRHHEPAVRFPASTSDEVRKDEGEVARLKQVLSTTPAANKKLLSETREALRDVELRLKTNRQNLSNSPAALLQQKTAALAAAKAELARVEKHSPTDKVLLSGARNAVWDLEAEVKDRRSQLAESKR